MKRSEVVKAQEHAAEKLLSCGIQLTAEERQQIEVAGMGLGELQSQGLILLTYLNNDRYCAKELIMYPRQTCPEHLHPPVGDDPGKMETFRCRMGKMYLYIEGEATQRIHAAIPAGSETYYTVFHELVLNPGDQYTIVPGTKHWFQAGDEGAIISEFSSTSRDEFDVFTDPRIVRNPNVVENE